MTRRRFVDLREAERTTLGDALERYEREVTPAKTEPRHGRQTIARLRRHAFALRPLAAVRPADIAAFIAERQTEAAGANMDCTLS